MGNIIRTAISRNITESDHTIERPIIFFPKKGKNKIFVWSFFSLQAEVTPKRRWIDQLNKRSSIQLKDPNGIFLLVLFPLFFHELYILFFQTILSYFIRSLMRIRLKLRTTGSKMFLLEPKFKWWRVNHAAWYLNSNSFRSPNAYV